VYPATARSRSIKLSGWHGFPAKSKNRTGFTATQNPEAPAHLQHLRDLFAGLAHTLGKLIGFGVASVPNHQEKMAYFLLI
jgi:hypothetical protein